MEITQNQQLINSYYAVVGFNDHAAYVRGQIRECTTNLFEHYAKHHTLQGSGLKVNSDVCGVLERLLSGEINPEEARRERHEREDEKLRLTGKTRLSRKDSTGRIRPSIGHKR